MKGPWRALSFFHAASQLEGMFHRTQLLLDQVDAYQRTGRWSAALSLCERVYQECWQQGQAEDLHEVILRTSFLHSARGDRSSAIDLFELSLVIADLCGDSYRSGRALNGLGVLYQGTGYVEIAEEYYLKAKEQAFLANDRLTGGDVELNLGILANIRGDLSDALEHYNIARSEYESIPHRSRLAKVLNNLGMLYIDLQLYDKAQEALEWGLNISRSLADYATEGIIHTNRTELFIATGDLDSARSSCDEAFEIASKLGDSVLKTDVLKCYGIIYREINKPHLAESHLSQAIQLASQIGSPLHEAEGNRELSLVFRSQDRNRESLEALNRAHVLFSSLQAKQDQAEINDRLRHLEEDFLALVSKWGESIEAKDHYTSGHCRRVADYACKLASVAGIEQREVKWFRMGAFLHDVGKTETPEEILNKPGRLTDEERAVMERHTVVGDEMLSDIAFPWDIRPMVRSHHERWDGRGYPDKLSGEDIPWTARVLKIADVYDALTTTRSYRDPLSPQEAIRIMTSDEGSFDPALFDLFCLNFEVITEQYF